jgi:hypothetical protein
LEFRKKIAALGRTILVDPDHLRVFDIEVYGVSEDQELDDRRNEKHGAHTRLAERLADFFANDI